MEADWHDMATAPKDRKILLMDANEDVFEGEWYRDDFIRIQNENLAFAVAWTDLPKPLALKRCEPCDTEGMDEDGNTCKKCNGYGLVRVDGKPWNLECSW
jgi:hypothetical protein